MGNWGIKVSKGLYTPWSADQKQIMHSGYPLLKLFAKDSGTLVKGAGVTTKTVEVTHGLGYIPQVFVFGHYMDYDAYPTATVIARYKLFNFAATPGLSVWDFYRFYADTTKLYITFTSNAFNPSSVSLPYTYFIFYDPETP